MKNILIGVDFAPVTEELLRLGSEMARAFDGRLRLLHVAAPDPAFVGYEPGPQTVRDSRAHELRTEHARLQHMADRLSLKGIQTDALMVQGNTSDTLLAQAEEWAADVIILGNRRHGFVRKAVIGSSSEGVIKNARCPVLLVPPPLQPDE